MLSRVNPTVLLVTGVATLAIVCASLLGLYALAPSKPNVAPLFAGIPGALAFVVTLVVARTQRGHGQALARITHQTNGVLTQRIKTAVTESVGESVAHAVPTALASLLEEHLPATRPRKTTTKPKKR